MNRGLRATAGAVLALLLTGAAPPDNRAIVTDFARLFYTERNVRAAFQRYVSDHYIQHNPGRPDGREPAIVALTPKFAKPGASFEIKRILVDGDMAVIHVHARPEPAAACTPAAGHVRWCEHRGRIPRARRSRPRMELHPRRH